MVELAKVRPNNKYSGAMIKSLCHLGRCWSTRAVLICVLNFCCFKSGVSRVAEQQSVRPNIIFALADDLGWNGVGYNGGEAHTPNLNEMSQSSGTVRLERHYSGSPVCSPTRGTVLTGRNHNRYCIWGVNSYSLARGDFKTVQRYPLPQTETSRRCKCVEKVWLFHCLFRKVASWKF